MLHTQDLPLMHVLCFLLYRMPTLSTAGVIGGAAVLWITEWKAVLQYVPIYGKRFELEPPK